MTLQELLKNDEDKRSDQGGKSGEWLKNSDGIRPVSRWGDMFIKMPVTSQSVEGGTGPWK